MFSYFFENMSRKFKFN